MTAVYSRTPRTRQPYSEIPRLNPDFTQYKPRVVLLPYARSNLVDSKRVVFSSDAHVGSQQQFEFPGVNGYVDFGGAVDVDQYAHTLVCVTELDISPSTARVFAGYGTRGVRRSIFYYTDANYNDLSFGKADGSGTPSAVNTAFNVASIASITGQRHQLVIRGGTAAAATDATGWLNGRQMASENSSQHASVSGNSVLGQAGTGSLSNDYDGRIWLFALFDSQLPDNLCRDLSFNPWQLFEPERRRIWVPGAAAAGRTGTLTATLGALTCSATGTVALKGTTTATLGALTSAATGTVALKGTASVTLGALTSSATGTVALKGTLSQTLGAATLAAEGVLTSGRTGTLTQTFGALTSAATGTVALAGTLSQTLGSLTLAATATNDSPVVAPVSGQQPAGKARRTRKRRYQLEIDGEVFDVSSQEEAVEVLEKAREQAEKIAEEAISRAAVRKKAPPSKIRADAKKSLVLPEIQAPGLEEFVSKIMGDIRETYDSALQTIEIAAMLAKRDRDEEDDEEVLLLLI